MLAQHVSSLLLVVIGAWSLVSHQCLTADSMHNKLFADLRLLSNCGRPLLIIILVFCFSFPLCRPSTSPGMTWPSTASPTSSRRTAMRSASTPRNCCPSRTREVDASSCKRSRWVRGGARARTHTHTHLFLQHFSLLSACINWTVLLL